MTVVSAAVEGTVPACEGDVTYTWTYEDCTGEQVQYVHTVTIDIPLPAAIAPTQMLLIVMLILFCQLLRLQRLAVHL